MAHNTKNVEQPRPTYAIAFIDGQNLFHCAREAYGYTYPNYDPTRLATTICQSQGWSLTQVRFYTGVPTKERDPRWHEFWQKKTLRMSRSKVHVVTRPLRYIEQLLDDGTYAYIPREKGIDVRIAIDVLTMAINKSYDVGLIFSQDQDLAELAAEIRNLARKQERWIKLASAFPVGAGTVNRRGINNTDWIAIDRALYDGCLDP